MLTARRNARARIRAGAQLAAGRGSDTVNTVCPGFIQTRWLLGALGQENYEKLRDAQEQTTPLRQAGTPEQMAEAVIFFLTSASNITGEFLIVDAGTHLGGLPMKGR